MITAKLLIIIANISIACIALNFISKKYQVAFKSLLVFFLSGVVALLPLLLLLNNNINKFSLIATVGLIGTYFLMALVEEVVKFIPGVIGVNKDKNVAPYIAVALGFAFLETIIYALNANDVMNLVTINVSRLALATPLHVLATVASGLIFNIVNKYQNSVIVSLTIALGIASALHGAFNIIQVFQVQFLLIPFLAVFFLGIKAVAQKT